MSKQVIAKVLETSDKHFRDTDFKTIGNYRKAVRACVRDQIEYTKANGITHIVDYGDICDKGYKSIANNHSDEALMREWVEAVNGNYYTTIGNHLYHEIDSNPELYWIQPSQFIKPKDKDYEPPEEPLLRTVETLVLGTFMYSFHHFNPDNKMYTAYRPQGITHHRAVYHDETMIPNGIKQEYNIHRTITSEYLNIIFANVDSAAVGHFHKPYPLQTLYVDGRRLPMDVPGSCCITSVKQMELHNTVKLPVITIYDDGSFDKEYAEFSLHIDMLKFYNKNTENVSQELLEIAQGMATKEKVDTQGEAFLTAVGSYVSPENYLEARGLSPYHLKVYNLAKKGDLTLDSAVDILLRQPKVEEDVVNILD